jgi:methylated-DNA-[protein]-cysteine S-methyltransferase
MIYQSPLGSIQIKIVSHCVSELKFIDRDESELQKDSNELSSVDKIVFQECIQQLEEYFSGKRKIFDLPLYQEGTEFQQKVWKELIQIPYGNTITYHQLAQRIGNAKSIRAAASANGRNKLWIVVPCHRVIGADGSLTGYAGGLEMKKWLLNHENVYANGVSLLF